MINNNINFEYPLQWTQNQSRTKIRKRAAFKIKSVSSAGDELFRELKRLGAKECIISSNLRVRMRGDGFYANQSVDDVGISVFFKLKGDNKVMSCDKWDKIEHNIWALCLSISAIRGLERWGGSSLLDGLFTGFKALPYNPTTVNETQYFENVNSREELRSRYKFHAKELHPDMLNGDAVKFNTMAEQYYKAKLRF